ncbi:MAG: hypothetical protein ABI347_03245 [Nitrososphaera sp.]
MSEKKPTKEEPARVAEVNDVIRDNTLRTVDEIAKVQPQIAQSASNLQLETIEASKNVIKTAFDIQKQVASDLNVSVPSQVSEQVVKQSQELTNNFASVIGVYNQLVINALNMARENARVYERSVNAATEYNTNILHAWTSFWATQLQQPFIRA